MHECTNTLRTFTWDTHVYQVDVDLWMVGCNVGKLVILVSFVTLVKVPVENLQYNVEVDLPYLILIMNLIDGYIRD